VASRYRVVAVLGDDLNDFVNAQGKSSEERDALVRNNAHEWGTRWFILPNPIYGSWEDAIAGEGSPCEKLQRKIEALKP
jgi:acid phosphatase